MLCGGVGGARAALALYENFPQHSLTFVVNTGDDFTHLGLEIWPDWDTVIYHLTGLEDSSRGSIPSIPRPDTARPPSTR